MARKRRVFSIRLQPILRQIIAKKHCQRLLFILAALLAIISTLVPLTPTFPGAMGTSASYVLPFLRGVRGDQALASVVNASKALELARIGQQYYNAGQFDQAASFWQQAANAYKQADDNEGMLKSLINQSQALQDLGLYSKSCQTLLQALAINNPECSQKQLEELHKTLSQRPDSLSLTQAIGLRSLGDVLRRQGVLKQSKEFLQLSLSVARRTPEESATLLSLGNTERALGNQTRDRWDFELVTEIIDRQSQQAALEPYNQAFNFYNQAATVASVPPLTKIQAQLNHFSLLLEVEKWWFEQTNRRIASWSRLNRRGSRVEGAGSRAEGAEGFLSQLESQLRQDAQAYASQISSNLVNLTPSRAAVYARIHFAQSLMKIGAIEEGRGTSEQGAESSEQGRGTTDNSSPRPSPLTPRPSSIAQLLATAVQEAKSLQDKRAETYALGYLGQEYYAQGQLSKATQLTRQALMLAQEQNISGDAREITYLWQSQLGRLLKAQGDTRGAIAAYTAAFNTLQSLRTDLNANDRDVQFDFRQEVKPVYLELADLLLTSELSEDELNLVVMSPSITQQSEAKTPKNRLELVRRVLESLQLAELDNFFQDPCSEAADVARQIDDIDSQAAVIYPIVFKDRLEVIFSLPGNILRQVSTPVSEREVNETLDKLYDTLYNESVDNSAINIFRTVPLNPEELDENIQKLLPIFTQVYNWLIRPFEKELDSKQIRTLVFVLNDRLQRVPMAALYNGQQYLIEKYGIALVPSLQLIDPRQLSRKQINVLAAGVSQQIQVRGEIFPALSKVSEELDQIKQTFPNSQTLLNEQFTAATIESQIKKFTFPVVHLATHGLFSSDPENTFIITGDRRIISISQLSNLLSAGDARAPELLVLSACETATGDERAVLGLAGVAVRSGARSTLATLWSVGDASTAQLMGQFYQQLKTTGEKKLDALRSAQLSLIESLKVNPPFEELKNLPPHPYYWAPYVLVGNWQ